MEKQQFRITVMELATLLDTLMSQPLSDPSSPILIERQENGDINVNTSAEGQIGVITTKIQ